MIHFISSNISCNFDFMGSFKSVTFISQGQSHGSRAVGTQLWPCTGATPGLKRSFPSVTTAPTHTICHQLESRWALALSVHFHQDVDQAFFCNRTGKNAGHEKCFRSRSCILHLQCQRSPVSDSSVLMIGVKQRMMRQHAGTDARTLGPKKPQMTSFPWADHHQTETERRLGAKHVCACEMDN